MYKRRLSLPLFLTPEQTSEVLNIPVRTVYEKIRQGKLPISPHGKPYRVDRDGLFRMARREA
jgi:excisionase family DNA binding protein